MYVCKMPHVKHVQKTIIKLEVLNFIGKLLQSLLAVNGISVQSFVAIYKDDHFNLCHFYYYY